MAPPSFKFILTICWNSIRLSITIKIKKFQELITLWTTIAHRIPFDCREFVKPRQLAGMYKKRANAFIFCFVLYIIFLFVCFVFKIVPLYSLDLIIVLNYIRWQIATYEGNTGKILMMLVCIFICQSKNRDKISILKEGNYTLFCRIVIKKTTIK